MKAKLICLTVFLYLSLQGIAQTTNLNNIQLPDVNGTVSGNLWFGGPTNQQANGMRLFGGVVNNSNIGGHIDVRTSIPTDGLRIRVDGANGSAERMRITAMGNVGIGTQNPQTRLHVNGAIRGGHTGGALRIKSEKGTLDIGAQNAGWAHIYTDRPNVIFNKSIYTKAGKFTSYGSNLTLGTNGAVRLTILKTNGNVGIGVTNPTNKLDVCGTIRGNEVTVETGWCDYVFDDTYTLPSLQQEANFIEANGHLLSFESEETMNGEVKLGDVTFRQQETIEKLMLHLIEMDNRIKELEAEANRN